MDIKLVQSRLARFAAERDWEKYHSPKNLAMALTGEAGELAEIFQWLTEEESRQLRNSPKDLAHVQEEIADIFIYLARLTDVLGIDLEQGVHDKMEENARKYPVRLSKGNATKYTRRDA